MGKQAEKQEYNVLLLRALIHNAYDAPARWLLAVQCNHINKYRHITPCGDNGIEKKKKKTPEKEDRKLIKRNILDGRSCTLLFLYRPCSYVPSGPRLPFLDNLAKGSAILQSCRVYSIIRIDVSNSTRKS